MKSLIRCTLVLLLLASVVPALAQQSGDGNRGNGATFLENIFGGFSLGLPGGPGCASGFQPGDTPQEWVRISPNGDFTLHVVDHTVTVRFWEAGATEDDVWIGPGRLTMHYTADDQSEQFNWRVTGTVTNALTGETRDAVCHVIVGGNNDLKKFDLELVGG